MSRRGEEEGRGNEGRRGEERRRGFIHSNLPCFIQELQTYIEVKKREKKKLYSLILFDILMGDRHLALEQECTEDIWQQ